MGFFYKNAYNAYNNNGNQPNQPNSHQAQLNNQIINEADVIKAANGTMNKLTTVAYHEEEYKPHQQNPRFWVGNNGTVFDSLLGYKVANFVHSMINNPLPPQPRENDQKPVNKSTGQDRPEAKYSNMDIHRICRMMEQGMENKDISIQFGFPPDASSAEDRTYFNFLRLCHDIRHKIRWASISDKYNIAESTVTYHSDEENERICQLICDGFNNVDIVDKIYQEFGQSITEGYVRIIRYCNKDYQPALWNIVRKYKDNFPSRKAALVNNENDIHRICQMMQDNKSQNEIAEAVGMENNVQFRALLSRIRAKTIYPHITEKYTFKAMNRKKLTNEEVWKILEMKLIQKKTSRDIAYEMGYADTEKTINSFRVTVSQLVKGQFFTDVREEFRQKYGI